MREKTEHVNFFVDKKTKNEFRNLCLEQGRSMTWVMSEMIKKYLAKKKV